jgi:hypothetical protein
MFADCKVRLTVRFLRFRLLQIVVATLFSTFPVTAQQPEIERAASKIAEKLAKDHGHRVIVADFYGPEREVVTELGRDLAGELSSDLISSAPNLVMLPRSDMEIHFSKYGILGLGNGGGTAGLVAGGDYALNPTSGNPDNVEEQEGASELALLAQADTAIVGRISRKGSRLQINLHVYLVGNPFFQSDWYKLRGTDGGELWNHQVTVKVPITSEYEQKINRILRRLPKDSFGFSAGTGQRGPELLRSECVVCREVPLDTGAVLFLILRVGTDGVVSVYSISPRPPNLEPRTGAPGFPEQASGGASDSVKAAVSDWHFRPFNVAKGQAPYQYRLLVVDGINHRVDLLPFAIPQMK